MSLNRFYNRDTLLNNNYPLYGKLYDPDYLGLMTTAVRACHIKSIEDAHQYISSEIHLYTFTGDLMASAYDSDIAIQPITKEVLYDVRSVFKHSNISTGSYKAVFNTMIPVFGNIKNKLFGIDEISPNHTETKINISDSTALSLVIEFLLGESKSGTLNNVILNFGDNQIYKVINFRYDQEALYFKTYRALEDTIDTNDRFFIGYEICDPYIDSLIIAHDILPASHTQLRGPRFNQDADQICLLYTSPSPRD